MQVFTEEQAEQFSFDVLDATKLIPEELVPLHAGRPDGAQPQPGQLLRRDRAGRVLHGARRSGHRLQQRSAARRAASTPTSTRRSRGSAARTSTRSRSTRRSRRCTTTSATACIARRSRAAASRTSRTRSAAAVRSRRARAGFVSFPQPVPKTTRCAASRRSSPSTTTRRRCSANSQTDWREGAHRRRLSLRAEQGHGAGDSRAHGRVAAQCR